MVQSYDTWYAVRTEEHVTLHYLRPFGLECGKAIYANALVPDRLRVKNRPVGPWTCEPNLNGLLDIVVSGGYSDVDRAVSDLSLIHI